MDVLSRAVTESQRYERLCLSRNSSQILGGNGGLFHTSALQNGGKNTSIRKLHLRRLWQIGWAFHIGQQSASTVPTPDGIAFLVAEDEGVGALCDFAGEDEVGFALLDF